MAIISSDADVERGTLWLAQHDPVMRKIHATCGVPPMRWREHGFAGLVTTITGQQLSVASANAIRKRMDEKLSGITPDHLLAVSDEVLRECGLSGPKIRTLRALSEAVVTGALPFDTLGDMPVEEAHAALVKIHGIGPWTAEVYMMFCLGVQDIFAPADLALQEGAKLAMDLEKRPTTREIAVMAEAWKPWRAVAARLLWAYYAHAKKRQGVVST